MRSAVSNSSDWAAHLPIGWLELHESVAIVEMQGQLMQHIEAEQAGNLEAGIVIDCGGIKFKNVVLVSQRRFAN